MRIYCALMVSAAVAMSARAAAPSGIMGPLKGGITEERRVENAPRAADPDGVSGNDRRAREVGRVMKAPVISRVTKVGEINKHTGLQTIYALPIEKVKINLDGSVDLGKIVDGSGNLLEVPPGVLKKGDLFTYVEGNIVEVAKDHFDGLGAMLRMDDPPTPNDMPMPSRTDPRTPNDEGPIDSGRLGSELRKVLDQDAKDAFGAADKFGNGLAKAVKETTDNLINSWPTLAPLGRGAGQVIDYLNNDQVEKEQALYQGAASAIEQMQKDAAGFFSRKKNAGDASAPLGELGRAEEAARVTGAARRVMQAERHAKAFSEFERGTAQEGGPTTTTAPATEPMKPEVVAGVSNEAALQAVYDRFGAALAQDARWGGAGAETPRLSARDAMGKESSEILNVLRGRFGQQPKDPYHGAGGLLESRLGVPVPTTRVSVAQALKIAGDGSRGIVFGTDAEGERSACNVRQENGKMEVVDGRTGKAVDLHDLREMFFYRTH